jgi:hypothetical protein
MPATGMRGSHTPSTNLWNKAFHDNRQLTAAPGNSRTGPPASHSPAPDSVGRRGIRPSDPLPAGSPVSWGAITRGTLLDGQPYPYRIESQHGEARP